MNDPIKEYYDFLRTNTPPVTKLLSLATLQQTPYVTKAKEVLEILFDELECIASLRVTYWLAKSWLTAIYDGQVWCSLHNVFHRGGDIDKYITFWVDGSIHFQVSLSEKELGNCIVWVGKKCKSLRHWLNRPYNPSFPNHWQLCDTQFSLPKEAIDAMFQRYDGIREELLQVQKDAPELKFPMFKECTNESVNFIG